MEDIEAGILVANALVLGVGGGDGSRLPLREPPLLTLGLEANEANLVRTEDHWGNVLFPREPVDPSLLLLQFGIRADLPYPDGLLGDVRLVTDHEEPLQADGGNDALADGLVPQAAEGPRLKGSPRSLGRLVARETILSRAFSENLRRLPGSHRGLSIAGRSRSN